MQAGNLVRLASLKGTHFRDALVTNAVEYEDLQLGENIGAGRIGRCRLRSLAIVATENLDYEVWLLGRTGGITADPDTNPFRGFWSFVAGDAKRSAGAGLYHYYVDGLDVPYEDDDRGAGAAGTAAYLHVGLVNRSAAAKSAAGPGELSIRFLLEPTYGW
jgi:hypothetical protein